MLSKTNCFFYTILHLGSISGGTRITINGDGFTSALTSVILDLTQYSILNSNAQITYNNITFTTLEDQPGTYQIQTSVNGVVAICETNCNFTFSSAFTPTVSSISPTSLTTPNTSFTISGTSFGTDMSKVQVTIGQVACEVISTIDTAIICTLPNLNLGSQSVNVLIDG